MQCPCVDEYDLLFDCLCTSLRAAPDFEGTHIFQMSSVDQLWSARFSQRENSSKTEAAKRLDACLSLCKRKTPLLEKGDFSYFNTKNIYFNEKICKGLPSLVRDGLQETESTSDDQTLH